MIARHDLAELLAEALGDGPFALADARRLRDVPLAVVPVDLRDRDDLRRRARQEDLVGGEHVLEAQRLDLHRHLAVLAQALDDEPARDALEDARVKDKLAIELPLRTLFEVPTIAALGEIISSLTYQPEQDSANAEDEEDFEEGTL